MPKKQVSLDVTQLDNFVYDMSRCIKCKGCYWVEHTYMPGIKFSTRCPSNTWNDFDSYGAFGKMRIGTAVAEGKLQWTPKLLEILYADPLCGACDVGCKRNLDLEIELSLEALRVKAVKDGAGPMPAHKKVVDKEREVKRGRAVVLQRDDLLKDCNQLVRAEKDLTTARLDCAKLEEKIDCYPETAANAEVRIPEIETLLCTCRYHAELGVAMLSLVRQRASEQEAADKAARRHGGDPDLRGVEEKDGEIKRKIEERAKFEAEIRAASNQPGSRGVGDIQMILSSELKLAKDTVENYSANLAADLKRLEQLVKRTSLLEQAFIKDKDKLLSELREYGIIISF